MPAAEREGCAAEVLAAYDAAIEQLARLGAEIVDVALPCRFDDATTMTGRIIGSEAYRLVGHLVDDPALQLDAAVRPRIQLGRGVSARDYLAALAEREALKTRFLAALDDAVIDALLTPTDANTGGARRVGRPDDDPGAFHAARQSARTVRARGAGRLHRDRAAAVVADHVPAV